MKYQRIYLYSLWTSLETSVLNHSYCLIGLSYFRNKGKKKVLIQVSVSYVTQMSYRKREGLSTYYCEVSFRTWLFFSYKACLA